MSIRDEIKKRYEDRVRADISPVPVDFRLKARNDFEYYALDDIEWLLSKLEIAEKALEWYSKTPHYDRRLSGGTSAMEADAGGRARDALQQLRS